jgi:bisphosphoglycerate-independent phosphoglycerate mutase (AlkP superfamily)
MGYESKLYVVEKTGMMENNNKTFAKVIATFDLCKFGNFKEVFKTETDCYIYADDGNTQIVKDCYNEALTEASLSDVIAYLEKYQAEQEPYRRVAPVLGLLKGFDMSEWNNIVVLHYGH